MAKVLPYGDPCLHYITGNTQGNCPQELILRSVLKQHDKSQARDDEDPRTYFNKLR